MCGPTLVKLTQPNLLRLFVKRYKNTLKYEPYLNLPPYLRVPPACLRTSAHGLKIETGRYTIPNPTPVEERLCDLCGVTEDEVHFLINCPMTTDNKERFNLFNHCTSLLPSFKPRSHESGSNLDSRDVDRILLLINPDLIPIPFTCAKEVLLLYIPQYWSLEAYIHDHLQLLILKNGRFATFRAELYRRFPFCARHLCRPKKTQ